MSLILLQIVRQLTLVTQSCIIKQRNTCYPVSVFQLTVTLQVVLTSCKVPHKVTPIHEVTLVREEEAQVLGLCRNLDHHIFSTTVVRNLRTINATHPALISLCMGIVVHTREQHILCIYIFILVTNYEI